MKKILIIQTDSDYFLFETLHTLTTYQNEFHDESIDLLINAQSIPNFGFKLNQFRIVSLSEALETQYDISYNFSLNEESWSIHSQVESSIKNGAFLKNKELIINDLWSTYLMNLKSNQPFLTFHLRDIYKNILSIKTISTDKEIDINISKIVYSFSDPTVFSADEQEAFINEIAKRYKGLPIFDISEIDSIEGFRDALYIGPPHLNALVGCTHFGLGIFLTERFQGYNLLPYGPHHLVISSLKNQFLHTELMNIIEKHINGDTNINSTYAVYNQTTEHLFGTFLNAHHMSDEAYPVYCSQVVLWNFLLNLIDTPLDHSFIRSEQKLLLKNLSVITDKLIDLYDHLIDAFKIAINETDPLYTENALEKVDEVDQITFQISESNSLLRSVLDFYRLRRSQPFQSTNLLQESLLLYTEEQQAFGALQELFNSTINSNNVNI